MSREASVEFLDQPRFPEAGLADDHHQLAITLLRALPAPGQHGHLLVTADQRRELALPGVAATAARAHQLNKAVGSGTPFSACMPRSSATKSPAICRSTRAVIEDRAGIGLRLHARRDIGASPKISPDASTTAGPVSRPMRASSSGLPLPAFLAFSRRARVGWRARRVPRVRHRSRAPADSRTSKDTVAELLGDVAAQSVTAAEAVSR